MDDFDPDNLDEETLKQLIAAGVIPDQMEDIKSQMETAQKLRDQPAPRGQTVGPDGVYVAASPLEHIAHTLQGIKAGRDLEKLRGDQQGLLQKQIAARLKYFQKYNDTPERRARQPFMQDIQLDPSLVPEPKVNF